MADSTQLMSDADFGIQSDSEFGVQSQGGQLMSDKDFGIMSDSEFGVKPQAEGPIASNVRSFAHGLIPAAGAVVGGAALGTAIGGPVGGIVGGIAGGIAGGMAGEVAQDKIQQTFPSIDDRAQVQANQEEYPISTQLSGLAPFAGNPGKLAGSLIARAGQGAMLGGLDVAQQAYQKGEVDPTEALVATGFGAVFPHGNKVTQAVSDKVGGVVSKYVPGRPGRAPNPDAAQAHADVGDPQPEIDEASSALAQPEPSVKGSTIGNPQSAGVGSEKTYPKRPIQTPFGMPEKNYVPTTGDFDPATRAAMAEPEATPQAPAAPPTGTVERHTVGNTNFRLEKMDQPPMPSPTVEAGFPGPGEPVATGANDATPQPEGTPARAAAAIKRSKKAAAAPDTETETLYRGEYNEAATTPTPRGHPGVYFWGDADKFRASAYGHARETPVSKSVMNSLADISSEDVYRKLIPDEGNRSGPWSRGSMPDNALVNALRKQGYTGFKWPRPNGGTEIFLLPEIAKSLRYDPIRKNSEEYTQAQQAERLAKIEARKNEVMPELKGETPVNDTLSDEQKAAGNFKKAYTHDFGKPVKIETHEGDIRRSKADSPTPWEVKLPYDYGYFGRTKGADKDQIDFARPRRGSPEEGQKHFIIDQKNAETGKFDEHKVFGYFKDEAAAIDAYNRGFSDNKGPQRLHAITEVDRPELVKWLAKHTNKPAKTAYSGKNPVAERAVVQDALAKLRAKGDTEGAAKLLSAPAEKLGAAIEGKRTRKYGVDTGNSAGYAVEGLLNSEGKPVTTGSREKAQRLSDIHGSVQEWFQTSTKKNIDYEKESNGDLLDRLRNGLSTLHGYDVFKKNKLTLLGKGTWQPSFKPKEWLWAREAKDVLDKPTPGRIQKFRDAERLLRGNDVDVENYRGGNRVDADIAQSRQSGDEAIANAEAKGVNHGVNEVEDRMNEAIDAKRKAFDTPHEEAEEMVNPTPVKTKADLKKRRPIETIDAKDSSLAQIDTKAISAHALRKAEADKLAGRKSASANVPSEDVKADTGRQIDLKNVDVQKLIEQSNKAQQKKLGMEALPPEPSPKVSRVAKDLYDHFVNDDRASLDINKVVADFKKLLRYTDVTRFIDKMPKTEPKSYIAKKSEGSRDDYARSLSTDLHRVGKEDVNQWADLLTRAEKTWPKELDEAARAKIFRARDADSASFPLPGKLPNKTNVESLPAPLKALYDKHLKPVFDLSDQFVKNIRAIDPNRIGPDVAHHISHVLNGDTAEFNMLRSRDDPMEQGRYHGLSVSASAAKNRKFFVLERASDGRRSVIEPTESGYVHWDKGKEIRIKSKGFAFEDGKAHKVGPVDYTMRQAMAEEKEANVKINKKFVKYFKDAGFAGFISNAQLGSMARNLAELARIRNTEAFKKYTTTNEKSRKVTEGGFAQSNLPNFKGVYMHPDLKAVFDDFAGTPTNTYQQLNAAVTKLIFVAPTAHIGNVGWHTMVSRGWDNLSIPKNMSMLHDLPTAIRSVVTQDPYQRRMNRAGSGTVYGKVKTAGMVEKLAKAFGQEMERDPSKWGPVADKLGIPLRDLTNSMYRHSRDIMWAGSDVFMTLRVRELQRKGLPMEQAIIDAERDIPNYRLPTKLFGSRWAAEKFSNSAVFAFARYHFGMVNSYAHIVKGLLGPHATMGDRVDAAGKLMAIGLAGMVLFPLMDQGWKALTGNEDAEAQRRGPLTIPSKIAGAISGKDDIMAPVRSAVTLSPLLSTGLETLSNHDWRGKPIVQPGDVREAFQGHVPGMARVIGQGAEHLARGLVAPYGMFAASSKKGDRDDEGVKGFAKTLGRTVRDQALDIKDTSPAAAKYERMLPIKSFKDVNAQYRRGGNGPFEGLIDKVFGR